MAQSTPTLPSASAIVQTTTNRAPFCAMRLKIAAISSFQMLYVLKEYLVSTLSDPNPRPASFAPPRTDTHITFILIQCSPEKNKVQAQETAVCAPNQSLCSRSAPNAPPRPGAPPPPSPYTTST
jgi:hypothetical protein